MPENERREAAIVVHRAVGYFQTDNKDFFRTSNASDIFFLFDEGFSFCSY